MSPQLCLVNFTSPRVIPSGGSLQLYSLISGNQHGTQRKGKQPLPHHFFFYKHFFLSHFGPDFTPSPCTVVRSLLAKPPVASWWIVDCQQLLSCGPPAWGLKLWFEGEPQTPPLLCLNTSSPAGVALLAGCGTRGEVGPGWWTSVSGVRCWELMPTSAAGHCSLLPGLCPVKTCR